MSLLIIAILGWLACHTVWMLRHNQAARPVYAISRSGKWPALRAKWLDLHGQCAACGYAVKSLLEVHHLHPVPLFPERELDPDNLITLCEQHGCHLAIGHNYDWHAYNPHVKEDAAFQTRRVQQRKYL
jgi:hypothetical protein